MVGETSVQRLILAGDQRGGNGTGVRDILDRGNSRDTRWQDLSRL